MNLSSWMGQLDDNLKNVPVINLAIPGTHDSMSYTVSPTSEVAPDSDHIVQVLTRLFGKQSRRVVYRWCVTQQLTLLQQLHLGIRYFDFRISARESDQDLYFVHGLFGDEVTKNLSTLKDFLEQNPEEIVILDFQHFYNLTPDHHQRLIAAVKSTFEGKLCPLPWDIMTVTLSWMIDRGYRVIAVYRNRATEGDDCLWPSVRWPTPWPQTTSTDGLLTFLTKTIAQRPRSAGLVTQCVLTPDIKFVARNPCGGLRNSCSSPCFRAVVPWLRQQKPGLRGINVVIADFVDTDGRTFSELVIGLNNSLLKS